MTFKILCDNKIYNFFEDYIESLNLNVPIQSNLKNIILQDYNKYLFIQKIPENLITHHSSKPDLNYKNIYLINTEQNSIDNNYKYINRILNLCIKIIEYSMSNIKLLNDYPNIIYLPYQFHIDETLS